MAAFAPQSAARGAAAGASPAKNACHGASGLRPARRPRGELRSAALRVTAAAEGSGVVRSGEPSSGRRWERLAGLRGRCDAVRCGAVLLSRTAAREGGRTDGAAGAALPSHAGGFDGGAQRSGRDLLCNSEFPERRPGAPRADGGKACAERFRCAQLWLGGESDVSRSV